MSGKVVTQMDRYKASSLEAFDTNHDAQSFLLTLFEGAEQRFGKNRPGLTPAARRKE